MQPGLFAKIRYIEDNVRATIRADDILEFHSNMDDILQFDKNQIYTAKWKNTDQNESAIPLGIQIYSVQYIQNEDDFVRYDQKRGVFPSLHESVLDEYYNGITEDEEPSKTQTKQYDEKEKALKKQDFEKEKVLKKRRLEKDKIDQEKVLKQKFEKFTEAQTLTLSGQGNNYTNPGDTVIPSVSSQTPEICQLTKKLQNMEQEYQVLQTENMKLKLNMDILKERLETRAILNERLQIRIVCLEDQLKEMQNQCRNGSPALKDVKTENVRVLTSTPIWLSSDDVRESEEPLSGEKEEQIQFTPKSRLSKRPSDLDSDDGIMDIMDSGIDDRSSGNRIKKRLYSTDSDLGSQSSSGIIGVPDVTLSKSEFRTISQNLFKKKNERVDAEFENEEPKKKVASLGNNKVNFTDEEVAPTMESSVEHGFSKFGSHESITNDENIKITYIYLNDHWKILNSEWKSCLRLKDASKFTKQILRLMHSDEDGAYDERLCTKCVDNKKVSFTPNGVNRRVPLTDQEHATIKKCLKYYCTKVLRLDKEKMENILAKKNTYITEDINAAIKKIKKKNARI